MAQKQKSKGKPNEVDMGVKVIVPAGLLPTNDRIYTQRVTSKDVFTRSNLQIVKAQADISRYEYIVVAADPNIKYRIPDNSELGYTEHSLKPGDIVRPFVVTSARDYTPVTDTYLGIEYTIFDRLEIASVVPTASENIELKNPSK